jgi:hypothetical protein
LGSYLLDVLVNLVYLIQLARLTIQVSRLPQEGNGFLSPLSLF